jgi:uncharacterized DUF497 family protein
MWREVERGFHRLEGNMRPQDIRQIFISDRVIEKNASKHSVSEEEIYEVFENPDASVLIRRSPKVKDVYVALGRTWAGRYLSIAFYRKTAGLIHVASARDMASNERNFYQRN